MKSTIPVGLCAGLIALMGVWSAIVPGAMAQEDCVDSYADAPLGPTRPENLVAFRRSANDAPDRQDVILYWVNVADNARCVSVDVRFSPASDTSPTTAEGEWAPLAKISDQTVDRYLHPAVPSMGEVCYRVYASNETGRSSYSNRVCLVLEGYTFPAGAGTEGGEDGSDSEGSGFGTWYIVAIALVAGAAILGVGAVIRRRASRPGDATQ